MDKRFTLDDATKNAGHDDVKFLLARRGKGGKSARAFGRPKQVFSKRGKSSDERRLSRRGEAIYLLTTGHLPTKV